ncbi:MAG: hypothetical protein AB8G99_26255, partial [Planctomycetaceae bacterium]
SQKSHVAALRLGVDIAGSQQPPPPAMLLEHFVAVLANSPNNKQSGTWGECKNRQNNPGPPISTHIVNDE